MPATEAHARKTAPRGQGARRLTRTSRGET
jgi:hypothetical protein